MKSIFFTLICTLLLQFSSSAQNKNTWIAFWNKDSTRIGFKDQLGNVKIKPKFTAYTSFGKFDDIVGVAEQQRAGINTYYLTKKGRIIGKNQLYIVDNSADCESEGFIRFRDEKTHKVGMFDKIGNIAIPPIYDNLMPVRNQMVAALKGGHWDESKRSEHNQYPWEGSEEVLINVHNQILLSHFHYNENIDFFSVITSNAISKNPFRVSFKAVGNKFYSFINYDNEFKIWLKDSLFKNFSKSNLLLYSYRNMVIWNNKKHWTWQTKQHFINSNFDSLLFKFKKLNSSKVEYHIFEESLNPYTYTAKEFEPYFDNCRTFKKWIYPVMNIVISYNIDKDIIQDQFSFLRTSKGYKLIEVAFGSNR